MGCVVCQKFLGRPSLSRREVELPRRDVKITSLCHVTTWIYTSRRQIYISLPRRDVDLHVATSNLHLSATSRRGFTRRDVIFDPSLPRRDVDVHVATSIGTGPCHVATWIYTTRRRLVMCSVTSRRDPERRDVVLFTLCDVVTSPRTSRRGPVFSPRTVHFGPSSHTPSLIGTLALLRTIAHRTRRSSHPTGRRPSIAHRPSEFIFEPTSAPGTGPLW